MRRIKTGGTWLILKIAFLRNLWYNTYINRTALRCLFLLSRIPRDFFYVIKRKKHENAKSSATISIVAKIRRQV